MSRPNPLAGNLPTRLGCASTYTAHIVYWNRQKKAMELYTELTGVLSVTWERVLDDFSEARINFRPARGDDCCGKLKPRFDRQGNLIQPGVWPWAHELVLYRNGELVWQGPVFGVDETVMPDESTDHIQIVARDFIGWLDRRVVHNDLWLNDTTYQLTYIARRIVEDAFQPDDPNVLQYLTVLPSPEKLGKRTVRKWEARSGDELRDIARAGLDFTCVGRAILIKPAKRDETLTTIVLRAQDFQSGIEIRVVGSEAATAGIAVGGVTTDGDPGVPQENIPPAKAYWPPTGVVDGFFGLIENWTQSEGVLDEGYLRWIAQQKVLEGFPPPTTLSVPADAGLSPDAPVSIHHLVPSTYFTILVEGTCRSLRQYMRLSHLRVSWAAEQPEQVGVTFIPGNLDDDSGGQP